MSCAICGGNTRTVIELPGFIGGDQALLQCLDCGHGMLQVQHPQACGYVSGGTVYSRRGVEWFLSHLEGGYECALDFGCNDGHLLRGVRAKRRIGVDLSMPALEFETHSSLDTVDAEPDLIVSRHTLEHLADPLGTLKALVRKASPDATFAIEVPCLDSLVESLRFDQIYNDHLQYFNIMSFQSLLLEAGLHLDGRLRFNRNAHSMLAICTKGQAFKMRMSPSVDLRSSYAAFRAYTLAAGQAFMCAPQRVAYGASHIFPVLMYHLGLQTSIFDCIVDDDPEKIGMDFGERCIHPCVPAGATVLVTAPDSFREIYRKCEGPVMSAVPML